jgi:hypothetical protein
MITFMILSVVVAFFLCQFPYFVLYMLMNNHSNEKWFQIAKSIADLLAAFNCCINFLIYCLFGQNFRMIAKILLCYPSIRPYKNSIKYLNSYNNKSQRQSLKEQKPLINIPLSKRLSIANNNNNDIKIKETDENNNNVILSV